MTNFKIIKQIFYQFLIAICAAFVFELIFKGLTISTFYNTLENILFSVLLVSPLFLIPYRVIQTGYITVAYILFCLSIYFEAVYYYFFEAFLSASSLFVSLDSNRSEATEFLNFYLDTKVIVFSIVMILLLTISVYKFSTKLSYFKKQPKLPVVKVSVYVLVILAFLKFSSLIHHFTFFCVF